MKVIVTEEQAKRIVKEMMLNEISSNDAYHKFYSQGDKFIQKDIYDSLMDGTTNMTPFHKMMLDAFLEGKANYNFMALAGDIWRSANTEMRQYMVNAASEDREFIMENGRSLWFFLQRTKEMKSHTENSFHLRGFEVLYEDDGIRVTCTKSYTSSCRAYGDSHWCTASDMYGQYNGFEMFKRYTVNCQGFLVQFICKGGDGIDERMRCLNSYQVAYQYYGDAVVSNSVFNWFDSESETEELERSVASTAESTYAHIFGKYIVPNAKRLIKETAENILDESEYYSRKDRVRKKTIFQGINNDLSSKDLQTAVVEYAIKEKGNQIQGWNNDLVKFSVQNRREFDNGIADVCIVSIYYIGSGALKDYIEDKCQDEDMEWLNGTIKQWIIDRDGHIVQKINGTYQDNYGNIIFIENQDGTINAYDARNGKLLVGGLSNWIEKTRGNKGYFVILHDVDEDEDKQVIYNVKTCEQANAIDFPEIDEVFNYFSGIPKVLICSRATRYINGELGFSYLTRDGNDNPIVPNQYLYGPVMRMLLEKRFKLMGDNGVFSRFKKGNTEVTIERTVYDIWYLGRKQTLELREMLGITSTNFGRNTTWDCLKIVISCS